MRRMTLPASLLAIGLIAGGAARADEASHRLAAERLLDAAGTPTAMRAAMDSMLQMQLRGAPQLAPYEGVLRTFLEKHVSYEALKDELLALYVADFTEAELDEIAAFYRTPTGTKAVARLPMLVSRASQLGERRVRSNQGELVRLIQEEQRRLGGQPQSQPQPAK